MDVALSVILPAFGMHSETDLIRKHDLRAYLALDDEQETGN